MLYLEGFIAQLPPENCCGWATASGNVVLENQNVDPGMQIEIPITYQMVMVFRFTGTLNYDPVYISLDTIEFAEATDNYIRSINIAEPGTIKFSGSGTEPLQDSLVFLLLTVSINENFMGETIISY